MWACPPQQSAARAALLGPTACRAQQSNTACLGELCWRSRTAVLGTESRGCQLCQWVRKEVASSAASGYRDQWLPDLCTAVHSRAACQLSDARPGWKVSPLSLGEIPCCSPVGAHCSSGAKYTCASGKERTLFFLPTRVTGSSSSTNDRATSKAAAHIHACAPSPSRVCLQTLTTPIVVWAWQQPARRATTLPW